MPLKAMIMEKQRRCKKCGLEFKDMEVEVFFRKHRNVPTAAGTKYHKICIGCELTERTEKKIRNRELEKAWRTIRSHAQKYMKLEKAKNVKDFTKKFRFNPNQIAHDIKHALTMGNKAFMLG